MPTLQDVARRAGVSIATVSKVLSNTPYFTEETRAKVMQAVDEIGYVPNLAARALSSGRTSIIAVVFPYVYDTIFKDPLVLLVLEGIEAEMPQRGYNLLLSTPRLTSSGPDESYQRLIQSGYIEGLIAIDNVPVASAAQPAIERGVPVVVLGYHQAAYQVRSDDFLGGQLLTQHVLEHGHRRIGVIGVEPGMNFAVNQRFEGVKASAAAAGLDPQALPAAEGDFSSDSGAKAAAALLHSNPDITAFICLNDRMAVGAIQYLHMSGRKIPDDVTVVGYDDIATAALFTPSLTTVTQHAKRLGQAAASMLLDVLDGHEPSSVVLRPELIVRNSSGPAPRFVNPASS